MNERHTLLVAASDERTRGFLCDQLAADGFAVQAAQTAEEARAKARNRPPDVLVLAELEERREALELLREIRSGDAIRSPFDPELPIVMLGAERAELTLLRAFAGGCDDFVAPLSYVELRARLRALIRRVSARPCGPRRVGALAIEPHAHSVSYGGERLALSRIEFALLERLAAEPTHVVTKDALLREVWGYQAIGSTRTVDAHACRLRAKLAAAGARNLVLNVRGVGYRLTDLSVPAADETQVGVAAARDAA